MTPRSRTDARAPAAARSPSVPCRARRLATATAPSLRRVADHGRLPGRDVESIELAVVGRTRMPSCRRVQVMVGVATDAPSLSVSLFIFWNWSYPGIDFSLSCAPGATCSHPIATTPAASVRIQPDLECRTVISSPLRLSGYPDRRMACQRVVHERGDRGHEHFAELIRFAGADTVDLL